MMLFCFTCKKQARYIFSMLYILLILKLHNAETRHVIMSAGSQRDGEWKIKEHSSHVGGLEIAQ